MQNTTFKTGLNIIVEALEESNFSPYKKRIFNKYLKELSQSYNYEYNIDNPFEIDLLISFTAKYFNITVKNLIGHRQFKDIIEARYILTYLLYKHFDIILSEVAEYIGKEYSSNIYRSIRKTISIINNKSNISYINNIYNIESFLISKKIIKKENRTINNLIKIINSDEKILFDIKL
jgi:chromosomal replication initiation ATPase DnaA